MTDYEKLWDAVPGNEWIEERDLKEHPTWGADISHSIPRMMPMEGWFWMKYMAQGYVYANEKTCRPSIVKGLLRRIKNGADFATFIAIDDEEEEKEREAESVNRVVSFSENFPQWWQQSKEELIKSYTNLRKFDLTNASNIELLDHFYDLQQVARKMWKIHFLGLFVVTHAWVLLEELCKEFFDFSDLSLQFQKLMSGYDNKMLQVDMRLWQLSRSAVEKGISNMVLNVNESELFSELEKSENGKSWLNDFKQFLDEDGHRTPHLHVFHEKTWFEDPGPAIVLLRRLIEKNDAEFTLEAERERLIYEREETLATLIPKVPDERKDEFMKLLSAAQLAGMYNEEHTYYCENYCNAMTRRSLLGIGSRLVEEGVIEKPEDILFMNPPEVEGIMTGPEGCNFRDVIERRRNEWEEWHKEEIPPLITSRANLQEAFAKDVSKWKEPIFQKIVGGAIVQPEVNFELKADFYGLPVSRGIAEGPARVVIEAEQLSEIQEGEILVAEFTTTSWTSVFSIIKGVVTDVGGALSHTAIVSREHGVPAVTNILGGTKAIKTGQRIRVDGNEGAVYILDK